MIYLSSRMTLLTEVLRQGVNQSKDPPILEGENREFEVSSETLPEQLNIKNPEDIKRAVGLAAAGKPIAIAGGTLYGLGGRPEAFQAIAIIKGRSLEEAQPAALASWERIKQAIDWEKLAPDQEEREELQKAVKNLCQQPVHIIAPIKKEEKTDLPFTREEVIDGEAVRTQAFICSESLPAEIRELVAKFEEQTGGKKFLVTSANRHDQKPYTDSREVMKNLRGIAAILKSPDLDEGRSAIQGRDDLRGCSYTMINLTHLAEGRVIVQRLGTHWSLRLDRVLRVNGVTPELDFSHLELGDILTAKPELFEISPIR